MYVEYSRGVRFVPNELLRERKAGEVTHLRDHPDMNFCARCGSVNAVPWTDNDASWEESKFRCVPLSYGAKP
jgi:hypothetical protein